MIDINIQNPWWIDPTKIERDEKVAEALRGERVLYEFNIQKNTILFGPRQVGKTTMIKLFIRDLIKKGADPRNILYFSCEPISRKEELIEILSEYDKISHLYKGKKYIFLDEVTFVKDWELAIKYFVEALKTGILIATGSNASLLKTGIERLPGRDVEIKFVLPFTFREFLLKFGSMDLKNILEKKRIENLDCGAVYKKVVDIRPFSKEIASSLIIYLNTGGYIKAIYEYANGSISESTYRTYVNWILGDLSKLDRREQIFQGIIRGITSKYTSSFALNSFSKEMEIHSHVTVSDYLETLENLLLVNNIFQIDINKKIPLFRKERKTYFLDPFMYSVFKGYTTGVYKQYIDEDKIIEGVVCEALRRLCKKEDADKFVFFYKKEYETDFVFKSKDLVGLEVKWNSAEKRDFKNFFSFKQKILLNKTNLSYKDNLLICPVSLFLALV